ncbi:hypothetical protein BLOT_002891, partial [Blomia tropicalis]
MQTNIRIGQWENIKRYGNRMLANCTQLVYDYNICSINELLPENTSQSSFNDEWNSIKETLSKASEITIGYKPKAAKKLWFDDDFITITNKFEQIILPEHDIVLQTALNTTPNIKAIIVPNQKCVKYVALLVITNAATGFPSTNNSLEATNSVIKKEFTLAGLIIKRWSQEGNHADPSAKETPEISVLLQKEAYSLSKSDIEVLDINVKMKKTCYEKKLKKKNSSLHYMKTIGQTFGFFAYLLFNNNRIPSWSELVKIVLPFIVIIRV